MQHTIASSGKAGCGRAMMPIPVMSNPSASEWYCEPCHDSIRFTSQEIAQVNEMARARIRRASEHENQTR